MSDEHPLSVGEIVGHLVVALYRERLGRDPDPAGWLYWVQMGIYNGIQWLMDNFPDLRDEEGLPPLD